MNTNAPRHSKNVCFCGLCTPVIDAVDFPSDDEKEEAPKEQTVQRRSATQLILEASVRTLVAAN